jgi:hypothetical protein
VEAKKFEAGDELVDVNTENEKSIVENSHIGVNGRIIMTAPEDHQLEDCERFEDSKKSC